MAGDAGTPILRVLILELAVASRHRLAPSHYLKLGWTHMGEGRRDLASCHGGTGSISSCHLPPPNRSAGQELPSSLQGAPMPLASNGTSPCAACKLLRRRCAPECVFAPHFPAEQPHKFAIVHRVFGASNTNKMLQDLPPDQREDAVSSLVYEAEARFRDPVYGCVGAIASLQQQVAELQVQLAQAQAETVYARLQQATTAGTNHSHVGSNNRASSCNNNNNHPAVMALPLASLEALPLQQLPPLALDSPCAYRKEKPQHHHHHAAAAAADFRHHHLCADNGHGTGNGHGHGGRDLVCVEEAPEADSDMETSKDTKDGLLHPISLNVVRNNFLIPQDDSPFSVDSVMDLGDMDSFNSINQMSPPTPPGSPDLLSPFSKPIFHSFALGTAFW